MKPTVYGSHLCPDTIYALNELIRNEVEMEYKDISGAMQNLKAFLTIRDQDPIFDECKERGSVGIPYFVFPDGTKTFDCAEAIKKAKE